MVRRKPNFVRWLKVKIKSQLKNSGVPKQELAKHTYGALNHILNSGALVDEAKQRNEKWLIERVHEYLGINVRHGITFVHVPPKKVSPEEKRGNLRSIITPRLPRSYALKKD